MLPGPEAVIAKASRGVDTRRLAAIIKPFARTWPKRGFADRVGHANRTGQAGR